MTPEPGDDADTGPTIRAADVLAGPIASAADVMAKVTAPPRTRTSDVLARQLLSMRAMLDALALQLDATFDVVNQIQRGERSAELAESLEDAPDAGRSVPPTFGARRRAAAADGATIAPTPTPSPGR